MVAQLGLIRTPVLLQALPVGVDEFVFYVSTSRLSQICLRNFTLMLKKEFSTSVKSNKNSGVLSNLFA